MPRDTILIADDDRVTFQVLSAHLKGLGYQVAGAADVMQAVMFAMRNPPAAILLDIRMPGGTGLDVLKKLKASIKTSHVPVIIITGSDDPGIPTQVKEMGADDCLHKPIDLGQLTQDLKRLLGEGYTGG